MDFIKYSTFDAYVYMFHTHMPHSCQIVLLMFLFLLYFVPNILICFVDNFIEKKNIYTYIS